MGQTPIRGARDCGPEHYARAKGRPFRIYSHQNIRTFARDNTGKKHRRHTPNPRIEIKYLDSVGNGTRAAGVEGRDSTDHAKDLWYGQKPWWNWYLTPVVNFGELRRAQLAKSTLLTCTLGSLGSFQMLERVWCGKQPGSYRTYLSLVKLQPWCPSLQWKTCPWAELTDGIYIYTIRRVIIFRFASDYCLATATII